MSVSANVDRPRQDLLHSWSAIWLWCLPIIGLIIADNLYSSHRLSFSMAGTVIIVASFWIGAACYANSRRCNRFHCRIDSYALPLLGVAGLANLIHLLSFAWSAYTNIFAIVVALSFLAEYLYNRSGYNRGQR